MRQYNYPVWGTQGGGLVREVNGRYIFVEKPALGTGLDIGDDLPDQWDLIPANEKARIKDSDYTPDVLDFMDLTLAVMGAKTKRR